MNQTGRVYGHESISTSQDLASGQGHLAPALCAAKMAPGGLGGLEGSPPGLQLFSRHSCDTITSNDRMPKSFFSKSSLM